MENDCYNWNIDCYNDNSDANTTLKTIKLKINNKYLKIIMKNLILVPPYCKLIRIQITFYDKLLRWERNIC